MYTWLFGLSLEALLHLQHAAPILSLSATALAWIAYLLRELAKNNHPFRLSFRSLRLPARFLRCINAYLLFSISLKDSQSLYRRPVYHTAALLFFWALVFDGLLFWRNLENGTTALGLPWLFLALALSCAPLLPDIRRLRSSCIVCLLSMAFSSFFTGSASLFPYVLIGWSFVLLASGIYLLPRFNAHFSQWFLSPPVWSIAGLVLVLSTLGSTLFTRLLITASSSLPFWPILTGATIYLLLLSQSIHWVWLPWLAGLGLTVSGLSILTIFLPEPQDFFSVPFLIGAAGWLNLILRIMPTLGQRTAAPFSITHHRLDSSFFLWPSLLICGALALFTPMIAFLSFSGEHLVTWLPGQQVSIRAWSILSILHVFSIFHLFILSVQGRHFFAHLLLLALTNTLLLLRLEIA
ncbi:MAG: hypothetical protein D3923_17340, partial [Candidatus Electrothrix sp. AR3]|nr:hypothetical protein [Candidatus Electrothrix sp. AR3]